MTTAVKHECKSCRWWNKARRATWNDCGPSGGYLVEHAQCRRYAPGRVTNKNDAVPDRVWPHVNANDWCGDFEPRDND
jgi:hypothetical protein